MEIIFVRLSITLIFYLFDIRVHFRLAAFDTENTIVIPFVRKKNASLARLYKNSGVNTFYVCINDG